MSTTGGNRFVPRTSEADPFASLVDAVLASPRAVDLIRQVLRAELQRVQTTEPMWTSKQDAHRRGFPAPTTLRAWQASGLIAAGRRGRVNLEELRRVLATQGREPRPVVTKLDPERAKRVAATLAKGGGRP